MNDIAPAPQRSPLDLSSRMRSDLKKAVHHGTSLLNTRVGIELYDLDGGNRSENAAEQILAEIFVKAPIAAKFFDGIVARINFNKDSESMHIGAVT